MTRDEMIDTLIPVLVNCGESPTNARRRLWRMSTSALEEPGEAYDDDCSGYALLRWPQAPLYPD